MNPTHTSQRVAVLADTQNLYHSANNLYSSNVDYSQLLEKAIGDRNLVRAIAYVTKANNEDEEKFFDALEDIGFEVKSKNIKTFNDGSKKADWDVGISLDAVTLANHVDTLILASGDGDFSRLCSHLRHEGVKSEIISFGQTTATELIEEADSFTDMANHKDEMLLNY